MHLKISMTINKKYEIRKNLTNIVYKQLKIVLLPEILIFTILLQVLWNNDEKLILLSWYIACVSINFIRYAIVHYYLKQTIKSIFENEKWVLMLVIMALVGGILYGTMASILVPSKALLTHMFIVIILIGIVSIANITYSAIKHLYLFFLLPAYIPHIIWIFLQSYWLLGTAAIVYLLVLIRLSININNTITTSTRLQVEMQELANHLNTKNEQLQQINQEIENREHAMILINKINEKLQMCQEVKEAYTVINETAKVLFKKWDGGIAIIDQSSENLQTVTQWGNHPFLQNIFPKKDCWAAQRGNIYISDEFIESIDCHHFNSSKVDKYLCVPLMDSGKIMGILNLCTQESKTIANSYFQQLAITFAEVISLSISNINLRDRLRDQSIHDPLTGLFNRRYLDERFPLELQYIIRNNGLLSIGMIDLDYFKKFNDTYGHKAGDEVLKSVGNMLKKTFREYDFACRFGGEEFIVILKNNNIDTAFQRMQEFRNEIKRVQIIVNDQLLPSITISVGLIEAPSGGTTVDELLRKADQALYMAKQQGRDRVEIYEKVSVY
jgi:diguanylate cyclase (GGDEF)-like protein